MRSTRIRERTALARWRMVIGCDLRSLAVFRVLLAGCMLVDLGLRATDLRAFYTDQGILPRRVALEQFEGLLALPFSLHLAVGSTALEAALFLLAALAALALLLGYRARAAALAAWLLTGSVQLRNLFIGGGYDALLRMLLLWSVFLPLDARWSLRAASRPSSCDRVPVTVASIGTFALLVQMALVYAGAGIAKLDVPAWADGTALTLILQDDFRVSGLGQRLLDHPKLCALLTHAVLSLELAGPLLLFVPFFFAALRLVIVTSLLFTNMSFALALHVGLFPWIASAGLVALLPGWLWDRLAPLGGGLAARAEPLGSKLRQMATRLAPPPAPHPPSATLRFLGSSACALALIAVLGWNFNVFLGRSASASPVLSWIAETLFLQQAWGMFAQPATRTGWLVMEGKLRDGATIDLLSAGGAAPGSFAGEDPAAPGWAKPDLVALQFKNDRWRIFLSRAVRGTDTQAQLLLYGRYLCREWNGSHTGDRQLETFELWFLARPIGEGTAHDYAKDLIWSHSCFASTANLNRSP